jgi:hypothetical protein
MNEYFSQVVIADFEYEIIAGDLPNVLCMVVYVLDENLRHVRTIRLWRGEFGSQPPFDLSPNTLFSAYSAWAELTCFMRLGWRFPARVFDCHTAYLAASNILNPLVYDDEDEKKKPRKRLPDACCAYEIEGWELVDKEIIAADIGNGQWQKYGRDLVFEYCEEDVRKTAQLLRRQLRGHGRFAPADVKRVLHWSNYSAKASAQIQAKGMPIDMHLWDLVQENKPAVIDELRRQFDPSYGTDFAIYSAEGEWSYERFERFLVQAKVPFWPRLASGPLDISGDAFGLMQHLPWVPRLHALRDSLGVIVRARLPIGKDGRNRPSLFPFGTATGRNAHAKSLYNAHAGLRSFMVFPPSKTAAYLDWRTQEIGVVAALSKDPAMMAAYGGGDVYYSFARSSGLTSDPDQKHWKANNPDMRQRMKALALAVNYGMSVPSLARGLDRHPVIASGLIEQHRRVYPRFWQWRGEQVTNAMLRRRIDSVFGWPLHISTSPNKRTLFNFPAQANGAEMLRLAAWRLCEAGLVPSMLIHDGILIELDNDEQIQQVTEIMKAAGRDVCNGFEIGVDIDQLLRNGARYQDKRPVAKEMWTTIIRALETIGALPRKALA